MRAGLQPDSTVLTRSRGMHYPVRMNAAPRRDWTFLGLLATAFAAGFSIPLGRAFLALTLLLLVGDLCAGRRRLRWPVSAWLWLLLVAVACVVTWHGVNPAKGLHRLNKLVWYAGLPLAASIVDSRARAWSVVRALVLGSGVLAVRVLLCNPVAAQAVVRAAASIRHALPFTHALLDQGTLADSQRLLVGLVGAVALWLARDPLARGGLRLRLAVAEARSAGQAWLLPVWLPLAALSAGALALTLKRSSWIAAVLVLVPLAWRRVGWRRLLLVGFVAAAAALALPVVRNRLFELRAELTGAQGGRIVMWTQVAPALLRQHPWGIGFRSLTPELMRQCAPGIEPNRDHLHSNPVEMTVSLGWLGLAVYLAWMGAVLWAAFRADRARPSARHGLAAALGGMFVALLLNGLVEYNFADAELVLVYGLLMGLAAAASRPEAAGPAPEQPDECSDCVC